MNRILLMLCLVAYFPGIAQTQKMTISVENVPLKKVIKLIEDYGEYKFAYRTEYLQHVRRVSVHVKNGTVQEVMEQALKGLELEMVMIGDGVITVRPDSSAIRKPKPALLTVDGQILNEAGEPLDQVSIQETGSHNGTTTNFEGQFKIAVKPNAVVSFSSVGFEPAQRLIKEETFLIVRLKKHVIDLDETVITGYGKTSKRYNTGSIYKVNQLDIARQPVSDPLATLQGRIPGLLITQSNGLPGAPYKIQLRGQSSIGIVPGALPPNDPLFIINGVPYAPNNNPIQGVTSGSALGEFGRSPLSFINIGDIDHIEVLKDADATAIYGSRGSNGVILITTKKGKPGPQSFTANIRSGYSQITRYPDMMNTAQYIQMRREALANDGLSLDKSTAPDLTVWDTTRYTDFKKMLIGGTAVYSNAQLALSGGSNRLQYYVGAGYHRETTVFPADLRNERLSGHANLHYQSKDSNLNATLNVIATGDKNRSLITDITNLVNVAPHSPVLYDSTGKLNWREGDLSFTNPMSLLLKEYESKTSNLLGNLEISYRILDNLLFKTSLGYNRLRMEDISLQPGSSFNPYTSPNAKGLSYFGKLIYNSWIAEPQLEYNRYIGIGKISGLLGATMQLQTHSVETIEATDFASDALLRNIHEAGSLINKDLNTEYRYGGVFARLTSILFDKYLVNLTGRTDGSSRFGPGKQVGNFWSAGLGWIFSNEPFMKNKKSVISFGKLRSSYGVTGNDQIGDYKYLDKWQDVSGAYLGSRGIDPVQLADSNYSWEVSRKLEAALDLGLFNDRLMISVAWYRNRTGNQLISYTLPSLTGFTSYAAKNSNALVQNSGWEIQLQTKNRFNKHWQWNGNLLLTIPRNKLIAFPNLATSSYAHKLTIGQSLSTFNGYSYAGVNPVTGLFDFNDLDGDGEISFPDDYRIVGHFDPAWYGSIQSNWQYKGWQLDVFFEIRNQRAYNHLYSMYDGSSPGTMLINQPVLALNRWQGLSGHGILQQYTTGAQEAANKATERFKESNGVFHDASYCRLRNIELSYRFPAKLLKRISLKNFRLYLQAQNLFTITRYDGTDPETRNIFTLPPLRTIAAGFELNF
ncbi:SusC/RagA family TonB-linked outer membrane protein [Longitalea luteola]|uniref:SusC/RagA family TonB-linked outer membrane protein n=1 Tax=Longitalea luteola TaxID=2812563 RepID=UPI001A97B3A1|nr:SusC/RagA family TonB-linked outer membrane protein [Longitalea luteola]